MTDVLYGSSLQKCPSCGIDLRDRPAPNACTVCTFTYDKHTRVWRSSETWTNVVLRYAIFGLIVGVAIALAYRFTFPAATAAALPLLLAVVAPLVALPIRLLVSGRITGRFVALVPQGILVETRRPTKMIAWKDFDRLIVSRGVPHLQPRDSGELIPLEDIFDTEADLAAFREELERARRRPAPNWATEYDPDSE